MAIVAVFIVIALVVCVVVACKQIKEDREYTKANLGKVRVLTNGDAYIVQQYGMCGNYIDQWASYERECKMVFFKEQKDSESHWIVPYYAWYSLNGCANAVMLGFGKTGPKQYEIKNKDLIDYIKTTAEENFEKAKAKRDYKRKPWSEMKDDE